MRMQEANSPEAAGWIAAILYKFLPAGLGAAIMVAVDPPQSRKELFWRLFVAFACSYLFGDVVFDFLHSFHLFAFLDAHKRAHTVAVDSLMGATGWFIFGGLTVWLKKLKADPVATISEAKKELAE